MIYPKFLDQNSKYKIKIIYLIEYDSKGQPSNKKVIPHPVGELYDILNDLKNIFKMGDWHFDGLNVKCNFAKENVAYLLVAELEGNNNALMVNPS